MIGPSLNELRRRNKKKLLFSGVLRALSEQEMFIDSQQLVPIDELVKLIKGRNDGDGDEI